MGLFRRSTGDADEVRRLVDEVTGLRARLDEVDATRAELRVDVDGLQRRLDTPMPPPDDAPVLPPDGPDEAVEVVSRADHDRLVARVEALHEHLDRTGTEVHLLADRVTAMGAELTNQITELGRELDALGESATDTTTIELDRSALDELRAAQTRLANEQARYQIAFRDDLAELAERLGRRSTRP